MRYLCTQKDHGYRDSTNPLRGLNMPRLVGLQESSEDGCEESFIECHR
jgi:hypothetical protein